MIGVQSASLLPRTGHPAEQREGHGVEHRGLSGSGLPVQQEQAVGTEGVEIDLGVRGERPPRLSLLHI